MDTQSQDEEWVQPFYIGHHVSDRSEPVTGEAIDQANACNYDMLTAPITNAYFRNRVLALVDKYHSKSTDGYGVPHLKIPPLSHLDTSLSPGEFTPQLLGFTSSWIDICSPDPLISNVSKQVLALEIAYAAFCGLEYVFVTGPRLYHGDVATHGVLRYSRCIQEALSIGNHMQISIVLPMVDGPGFSDSPQEYSLSIRVRDHYLDDAEEPRSENVNQYGTWDAWNLIRSTCKYSARLLVDSVPEQFTGKMYLVISKLHSLTFLAADLPLPALAVTNFPTEPALQSRWYSEPIKAVIIPSSIFVNNKSGNTVLPTTTRTFISRLMRVRMGPWIILQDVDPIPPPHETPIGANGAIQWKPNEDPQDPTPAESASAAQRHSRYPFAHLEYIRWLQRLQPRRTKVEEYGAGYQDYLQIPLQPLTDNLESVTYEVFEKDPVKYDLYEKAIRRALEDWTHSKKSGSSPDGRIVVAVAGAGRGPLVARALKASKDTGVKIKMWAVEKNPNAFVLLQRHNNTTWKREVEVVQSDMRSWKGPCGAGSEYYPVDILISELLGSFADNELSPECLDGILHLLSPKGISIPHSYTSYLTPISAPKLHTDLLARSSWDPNSMETPAVVWLHAIDYLSTLSTKSEADPLADPEISVPPTSPYEPTTPVPSTSPHVLPVWSFQHEPLADKMPLPISNTHNERYSRLRFRTRNRGVCHGLGGYFESVLYPKVKDNPAVELSTNPSTMEQKSNSMISWFPIFFPLKNPLYVPDHSELTVTLWRHTDDRKVWYEWIVEAWVNQRTLDGDTKRVRLGISDLHSSIKNGCMM